MYQNQNIQWLTFNALQFEEPELFKVNQEVPSFETVETVLEFACTPLTGPEVEVINEQIRKPFTFR